MLNIRIVMRRSGPFSALGNRGWFGLVSRSPLPCSMLFNRHERNRSYSEDAIMALDNLDAIAQSHRPDLVRPDAHCHVLYAIMTELRAL
jgi:hypothetical protein